MKNIKSFLSGTLLCLIEAVVGILLLIDPVAFTSGIFIAAGGMLLVAGGWCIIRYFLTEAQEAAQSQLLLKGLLALLSGAFCVLKYQWFLVTFPLLTIVYGVVTLVTGLGKVQWTVDALRLKKEKWFLSGISAVVSIACAAVILCSPFTSTAILWMFTGISLIVEAVVDFLAVLLGGRIRQNRDADSEGLQVIEGEAVEVDEQ